MRSLLLAPVLVALPLMAHADMSSFSTGPVFEDYGPVADIDTTLSIPEAAVFHHAFDVAKRAEGDDPIVRWGHVKLQYPKNLPVENDSE